MAPELNSMHYARVGVIIGRKKSSWAVFFGGFLCFFNVFIACFYCMFFDLFSIANADKRALP